MSNDVSTSPCLNAGLEAAPLDRLLSLLWDVMAGVMAEDTTALKKANAIARLGNLYLKTYNTAALKHHNAELVERVAELEECLVAAQGEGTLIASAEDGRTESDGEGGTAAPTTEKAVSRKPGSHGMPCATEPRSVPSQCHVAAADVTPMREEPRRPPDMVQ